jgi:polyhydroxyalkanoate synthase
MSDTGLPAWLALTHLPLTGIVGTDRAERIRRGMWVHALAERPPVGQTPSAVVHTQDKLALRYYAPPPGAPRLPPVVLVPSLINRAYVLDLEPGRSLVEALATAGHPTYLVDWGTPGPEDADEDVGYVLLELLHRSIDRACRHAGAKQANVLGYCMGGTLAAMYAALRPERVARLLVLAAPVRFSAGGRFRDFVSGLDVEAALGGDLVPVSVMKPAFQLLDPVGSYNKFLAVEQAARDPASLRRVMVRERWLEDNVPMTGAFAREFIHNTYQHDHLIDGRWVIRGETVRLSAIACPTLAVTCEGDFITPRAAAAPLTECVAGAREVVLRTGHIGVVVGSEGPRTFYPLVDRFFRGVA